MEDRRNCLKTLAVETISQDAVCTDVLWRNQALLLTFHCFLARENNVEQISTKIRPVRNK